MTNKRARHRSKYYRDLEKKAIKSHEDKFFDNTRRVLKRAGLQR